MNIMVCHVFFAVSAVIPQFNIGFIATDMTGALPENIRQEWEKQIPLRRGGRPEDVAKVALFLASDLSAYVTGQVINCCGGMNC